MEHPVSKYRREHGLTLKDLADRLRVSVPYVHAIEKGDRRPGFELMVRIEEETGVPVSYWVDKARGEEPRCA